MRRNTLLRTTLLAAVTGLMFLNFTVSGENPQSKPSIKIIFKFDDFEAKNNRCPCIPTLDYLIHKQVKAGFGAIANRFDNTAPGILKPYLNATDNKGEKLFEVWNHGLDHSNSEFKGNSYEYQKDHFEKADQIIKQFLGIQMHTFGAPFNENDSVTTRVISENSNYKIFIFAKFHPSSSTGIFFMDHRVDIENGTGNPEYNFFVNSFNKFKDRYKDYMTLQGHPNLWSDEKLGQFKQIVDFLLAQGCEFVLPYEYYIYASKK